MPPNTMGEKIRALRKEAGLTLEQLADATDSSKSYIWELENRPTTRPSAEKIQRIASVLKVIPEYLTDDDRTQATVSDRDQAFFRKFTGMSEEKKRKLESILKLLDDD